MKGISIALVLILATAALADPPHTLDRPDGTRITWYLDAPTAASYPITVILQGSECLRVSDKYAPYIQQLNADGIGVLRVEKPGLGPGVAIGTCPEEYLRLDTLDRRVLDLLAVVAELRRHPQGWNGRIGLVGGSEGGMIAAMSAPLIPETRAVVLLSSGGGMPFAEDMLRLIEAEMRKSGAPEEAVRKRLDEMRATYAEIRRNPVWTKEWLSDDRLARNTYLWWSGALPVAPLHPLLQVDAPILVVHGEADTATPVESADLLADAFKSRGKTNLTFRRYPGMGHSPTSAAIDDALDWLTRLLMTNS